MSEDADIVIDNAVIIDGTGQPGFRGGLAISADRITAVGDVSAIKAAQRIDAKGHVVAPGFIDSHTHDDRVLLDDPAMACKVTVQLRVLWSTIANPTVMTNTISMVGSWPTKALATATASGRPITQRNPVRPFLSINSATTDAPTQETSGITSNTDAINAARSSDAIKNCARHAMASCPLVVVRVRVRQQRNIARALDCSCQLALVLRTGPSNPRRHDLARLSDVLL